MPFEGYDKKRGGATDVGADPDSSAGSVRQIHTDLQPIHHYRLFKFMRKHSLFDAWLGGGDGAKLLRDVRKAVRTILQGIEVFRPGGAPRRRIKAQGRDED